MDTFLALKSMVEKKVIFFRVNIYFWMYLLMPWWHINGLVRDPLTLTGPGVRLVCIYSQASVKSTVLNKFSAIREDFWCRCKYYDFTLFFLILDFFFWGVGKGLLISRWVLGTVSYIFNPCVWISTPKIWSLNHWHGVSETSVAAGLKKQERLYVFMSLRDPEARQSINLILRCKQLFSKQT